MSRRVALATLGCKVNQYETQVIRERFKRANFELASFSEEADIYVINTCSVTKRADEKSIDLIRKALQKNNGASVVVTGCLVEAEAEKLKDKFPQVKLVGNSEKLKLNEFFAPLDSKHPTGFSSKYQNLKNSRRGEQRSVEGENIPPQISVSEKAGKDFFIQDFYSHNRAFVKVEDGCNQFCTYCRIPFVRGSKPHSRAPQEVLTEIQLLINRGFKEIVLVGINLCLYGKDLLPPLNLVSLLEDILTLKGDFRIRLSSLEPHLIPQGLINLMLNSRICPHLHLPLQSGDDEILKRMGRRYTKDEYLNLLKNIRKRIPYLAISTDVMVGFPGEGSRHFLNTYNFIGEIGFSRLHIFRFSPREGTVAFSMTPQIEERVKRERSKKLKELGDTLSFKFISQFIEKRLPVLIEGKDMSKTQLLTGYTHNYIKVFLPGEEKLQGELRQVKLVRAASGYALGQL